MTRVSERELEAAAHHEGELEAPAHHAQASHAANMYIAHHAQAKRHLLQAAGRMRLL